MDASPLEVLWRDAQGAGARAPLVVLFHGGGRDEHAMAAVADYIPAAFAVASLRGPRAQGDGFAWYARDEREGRADPASFRDAVARIALTLEGFDERRYDTERLALVGFSSGAVVAAGYALAHPRRVKALALLSGLLPRAAGIALEPGRLSGIDVFTARGTDDTQLPPALVERTEKLSPATERRGRERAHLSLRACDRRERAGRFAPLAEWLLHARRQVARRRRPGQVMRPSSHHLAAITAHTRVGAQRKKR